MNTFTGDYSCRLDEKGRVPLPSAFIRQMAGAVQEKFVLRKDIFASCLVLYPMDEWARQNHILRQNTNPYNREHGEFLRMFFKGTAEITLDSNNRMLIPRKFLDDIGAAREIVMAGQLSRIEIWAKESYEKIESSGDQIADLAEKIMGKLKPDDTPDKSQDA
jgi:MraZ protein